MAANTRNRNWENEKNKDNIIQTLGVLLLTVMVSGFEASVFLFSNNKNIIQKAHAYITENVKLRLGSLLYSFFNWGVGPILI